MPNNTRAYSPLLNWNTYLFRSNSATSTASSVIKGLALVYLGVAAPTALAAPTQAVKNQVSEGLKLATEAKKKIEAYIASKNQPPSNRYAAGLTPSSGDTSGNYVTSLDINNGVITITYGNQANFAITGQTLSLSPLLSPDGHITWQCGNGTVPGNLVPVGGMGPTSIDNQYLPAPCSLNSTESITKQVAEGLGFANGAKADVNRFFSAHQSLPSDRTALGLSAQASDTAGNYVFQMDISNGTINVTYGNLADSLIAGAVLTLAPTLSPNNSLSWSCLASTLPPQYIPGSCSGNATLKAQIQAGLNLSSAAKNKIVDYFAKTGRIPAKTSDIPPFPTTHPYVKDVAIKKGEIIITYSNLTNLAITGKKLTLTPYLSPDKQIIWQCGEGQMPLTLQAAGPLGGTTLESRYLPIECAKTEAVPVNSQIAEGLNLAKIIKNKVERYIRYTNMPPFDRLAINLGVSSDTQGKYVSGVNVNNGVVSILYGNFANGAIQNQTLDLTPYQSVDGHITWVCGNAPIPPGLNSLGGTGSTTLGNQYLPVECLP